MIPAGITIEELNRRANQTLVSWLGIEFTASGPDWLEATMPVDERTRQPYGILHGGASVSLAETLGSMGSSLLVAPGKYRVAGLEINANHVKSISQGMVTGRAVLVHKGRSTHIWDIRIVDSEKRLICISRLTVAVLNIEGRG